MKYPVITLMVVMGWFPDCKHRMSQRHLLTDDHVKMIEKVSGQKSEQQKRSSFQVLPSGVSPCL